MRVITKSGWERIQEAFSSAVPIGEPKAFWEWASDEGPEFRHAAWFILTSADACAEDFDGEYQLSWMATAREATSSSNLPCTLSASRRALVADFILDAHRII